MTTKKPAGVRELCAELRKTKELAEKFRQLWEKDNQTADALNKHLARLMCAVEKLPLNVKMLAEPAVEEFVEAYQAVEKYYKEFKA